MTGSLFSLVFSLLPEIEAEFSNDLSSFSVSLVLPSRMIHIQFRLEFGHQMVTLIQFRNVLWIPSNYTASILGIIIVLPDILTVGIPDRKMGKNPIFGPNFFFTAS
jgi:hypothetical protein